MIARRSPGKGEKINMKLRLPVCPYCGKKVGFTKAWYLKREGEYRCPECGEELSEDALTCPACGTDFEFL